MPIYAYICKSCGFEKDALQKLSDPPLTICPSCSNETFVKKLTAPNFQLKGTGWYVTDFRDGGKKPAEAGKSDGDAKSSEPSAGDAAKGGATSTDGATGDSSGTAAAKSAKADAAAGPSAAKTADSSSAGAGAAKPAATAPATSGPAKGGSDSAAGGSKR